MVSLDVYKRQDYDRKKRVAAYCRVSTDKASQEESFETQIATYERLIRSNPEWEYAGIYSDEGKSATSARHRAGFQRMIADALEGKIDIILVKSICLLYTSPRWRRRMPGTASWRFALPAAR